MFLKREADLYNEFEDRETTHREPDKFRVPIGLLDDSAYRRFKRQIGVLLPLIKITAIKLVEPEFRHFALGRIGERLKVIAHVRERRIDANEQIVIALREGRHGLYG